MMLRKDKVLAAGLSDLLIQIDRMYESGAIQRPVLETLNGVIYQIIDEQPDCVVNIINRALVNHYTGFNQKGANK